MSKLEDKLKNYFNLGGEILEYFSCTDNLAYHTLTDIEDSYWRSDGYSVQWGEEKFDDDDMATYSSDIRRNTIHHGAQYTLILVEDVCGGSPYYKIFPNSKELKNENT